MSYFKSDECELQCGFRRTLPFLPNAFQMDVRAEGISLSVGGQIWNMGTVASVAAKLSSVTQNVADQLDGI